MRSGRARSATTGIAAHLFKSRKPSQAGAVDGRLNVTIERKPCQVFDLGFQWLEKARIFPLQECNRDTVAIEHPVAGERRKLRARRKDAGEIERIGTGD